MLIREKLEQEQLSNNEREIAGYMLEEGVKIDKMTVKELAAATYTSPATAVRLAHKMGYEGWSELKEAFLEEQRYLESHFFEVDANYPFQKGDTRISIAGKLATLEQETIADTQELLKDEDLFEAVRLLNKAHTIYLFAVSNNIPLAQLFAINLSRIGKPVMLCQLQGEVQYFSRMITADDCALILSYSGETPILVAAANYIHDKKLDLVSLTNLGDNTIARLSSANLKVATREKLYSKIGGFTTSISMQYLLDVLYGCLFAREYDKNMEFKHGNSTKIETGRFSTSEILKEKRI